MQPSSVPVSVVIPCYRCAATIGRAVASVAAQSVQAREVIVVDDCSTDDTLDNLYRLQKMYTEGWMKIISQTVNGGPGTARNAGWDAASQPYIAFLDADDTWHPDKLRIQYQAMCANPEVAISGHAYSWSMASQMAPITPEEPGIKAIKASHLLLKNRFSTPTVMLKKDLPFRFIAGKRYCEDYDLWLQIVLSGYKAIFINAPLTYLFKAPYGDSGLSAQLAKMERGELEAYLHLCRKDKINIFLLMIVVFWSISKYLLRLAIVLFRNRFSMKKSSLQGHS
ncbi:glycosyltransferase family 2 protein [Methylomicrobium sp. Wu6]|uniref:glycosyltransferase family 2 protein n=1 Tax=Methylomicrobium sp. Wu6 TaxID=3107928 RepID=UPI002DD67352|nr:glycosyltransferase family 2 protein [Methylomicrobium sp. Wu6]MEC4747377.1 glycosyltransferase family 2 protein [Methylomicrobium sp. Wu6]